MPKLAHSSFKACFKICIPIEVKNVSVNRTFLQFLITEA